VYSVALSAGVVQLQWIDPIKECDVNTVQDDQRERANEDLMEAARDGNVERVRQCLQDGAEVNARDKDGTTPLMWTAAYGRADAMKTLLDRGASLETRDLYGWTALMRTSLHGSSDAMKALLERGADLEAKSQDGWTALMRVAYSNQAQAAGLLFQHGVNLDAKDHEGKTALDIAQENDHHVIVDLIRAEQARRALEQMDADNTAPDTAPAPSYLSHPR